MRLRGETTGWGRLAGCGGSNAQLIVTPPPCPHAWCCAHSVSIAAKNSSSSGPSASAASIAVAQSQLFGPGLVRCSAAPHQTRNAMQDVHEIIGCLSPLRSSPLQLCEGSATNLEPSCRRSVAANHSCASSIVVVSIRGAASAVWPNLEKGTSDGSWRTGKTAPMCEQFNTASIAFLDTAGGGFLGAGGG
jgi:hypothetical protein